MVTKMILWCFPLAAAVTAIAATGIYIDDIMCRHGLVTGILYSAENSSAIIDGHIMQKGDVFNSVTIVEVNQFSVEFEKDGIRWQQRVREKPSSKWRSFSPK